MKLSPLSMPAWLGREYCEQPHRFARLVLGLRLAPVQAEWTRIFSEKRFFHAAPRDHGKSLLYAFLLPLWEMARDPHTRILLVSKTQDLASRFVTTLRQEIETNPRLRFLYGRLKPETPRAWNRYQLFLERSRNVREPTLNSLGLFGSCAGLRADLIIADDIIDSEVCAFRRQRDRVHRWFLSELTPVLESDGRLIVVGTRKHHDDLYSRLIGNPAYRHRIDRALLDESKKKVLMPERWSYDRLMADREEIGTVLFNREKQNQVIDSFTALFRREWLEGSLDAAVSLGTSPEGTRFLVQGIDLASVSEAGHAEEKDTDYSVVVTLGVDREDRLTVVDVWRERGLSPDRLLKGLIGQMQRHRPALVLVENNAFQHWVEQELRNRTDLKVEGHTTGHRNKTSLSEGLPSLAALFERGRVRLPSGDLRSRELCGELIEELYGLGYEKHDDVAMAFWFAVMAARKVIEGVGWKPRAAALMRRF
jgi:hypothetical protein